MAKAVRVTEHVDGGWFEGDPPVWHDYPAKGETAVLEDSNADNLVASGRAEYVKESRAAVKAETATVKPAPAETRAAESAPAARK